MAYITGTANTLADLLSAIQNACTANGWTLAGSVLYKGTCYVEMKNSGAALTIRGGTGIDASNNLTGACDTKIGNLCVGGYVYPAPNTVFAFPCTYEIHIHTAPDEVYVVVNYSTLFYETIGFGQSSMPGLAGTGTWYSGCSGGRMDAPTSTGSSTGNFSGAHALLYGNGTRNLANQYGVDHELDSATWKCEGAWRDWYDIESAQPNQWNSESILIPIRVYATRPSGFISPILECAHARYVDIRNFQDGQIITLGSDRWKVYPWWSRGNAYDRDGNNGTFTGTYGHALRYDGP